ncbi:LysR family transcriptional regulator [Methylobacterium sp. P31]
MRLKPSDISFFAVIVAEGSLSAAARALNTSPAAMSRRLSALEARLGVRLVTRTSRSFDVTEEGALFHERCVRIVAEIEEAEDEAMQGLATPRGHLRIGAPVQWGRRFLAPVIGRFGARYPAVDVHLVLSDTGLDVINDGVDIAIGIEPSTGSDVVVRKLLSSGRVVCAAPAYLRGRGTPQVPDDLRDHDCIRLVMGNRVVDRWRFREGDHVRVVHVPGRLTTTSTEVVNDWALAGLGIALRAAADVAEHLHAGALVTCLDDYRCEVIDLHVAFASKRHLPPRIRGFLDFLDAELASAGAVY